jgi:predicted ribosome quality control (RQC) complex YloA/Tae2 family protein
MLEIIEDNIKYRLGKNALENFKLIDDAVESNDKYWWFHLNDYPSGHCVIYTENIEKSMLIFAGKLIKQYSKQKNNKKIKIVYTQVKNLKKTKVIGQVMIKGEIKFFYI